MTKQPTNGRPMNSKRSRLIGAEAVSEKKNIIITETCPCNVQKICSEAKIENFIGKKKDIFNIFNQNIDCGYMLEPPCRGGSNKYPLSMLRKNKKKKCIPLQTSVVLLLYKSGVQGGIHYMYMDMFAC